MSFSHGGGGGTPSSPSWRVPHLVMVRGTLSSHDGGTPSSYGGGTNPHLGWGIWVGWGVMSFSHDGGGGNPSSPR